MEFSFPVIGLVHSCFKEKFGIPRQPGLAPLAWAEIEMLPPYDQRAAFDGLAGSSHIWVQFVFHANQRETWKPKVKPPRLGGNKSLGVFATRSPTRPAPIGLSVVQFRGICERAGKLFIQLGGVDLLDGTPVLDIKPYVPYVDCITEASNKFAGTAPAHLAVDISPSLLVFCAHYQQQNGIDLAKLITQVLQQDPRPSYQPLTPERRYGMKLLDLDVHWHYCHKDGQDRIQLTNLQLANLVTANSEPED